MATPNETDVKVDIALIKGNDGIYDFEIGDDGDFVPVYGFETSIIMSLLCERRAEDYEQQIELRRRGWIGDENASVPGFEIGSKLWLQYQARQTNETRNAVVDAARDALAWLVPTYLNDIQITGKLESSGISLTITAVRKSGKLDKLYFRLWELTGA